MVVSHGNLVNRYHACTARPICLSVCLAVDVTYHARKVDVMHCEFTVISSTSLGLGSCGICCVGDLAYCVGYLLCCVGYLVCCVRYLLCCVSHLLYKK